MDRLARPAERSTSRGDPPRHRRPPSCGRLLELYGQTLHEDWLRFLDEEILDVLPEDRREMLALLAVAERPVPWATLAAAAGTDGPPPTDLRERGLMLELADGMWLHEALRARLLREVGAPHDERAVSYTHLTLPTICSV